MASGMLSKTFRHRRLLFIAIGIAQIMLTWLGGHIANVLLLAGVIGVSWLLGGVLLSQSTVLIGLAAEPEDRGTAFGILGMTNGLGSLIGGLGVGYIADRFGYRSVFNGLAVFCILIVVGGLISLEPPVSMASEPGRKAADGEPRLGGFMILLLAAQLLVAVTLGPGNLGRSFAMNERGFSRFALTLTVAIQGLVSLGFPLLLGWLSDRIGRRWILIGSFAAITGSLVLLSFSQSMWQFCLFALLFSFLSVPSSLGPAYVVDIDPTVNVARGVSLYQAMFWVGCIVGMASAGYAIERRGVALPLLISSVTPAVAAVLLLFVREKARPKGVPLR